MNIDEKLAKLKYITDKESHLKPDFSQCQSCQSKACVKACPAKVYEWINGCENKDGELIVKYENCLECGACRIVCEKQTLGWEYPKRGVRFKNS